MKNIERKIGPKFGESYKVSQKKFKARLYEDKIDFDRMRMYRLNRVREQLLNNDIGACILFDPINIRYATDTRNMSVFSFHLMTRYVFIPASGPVILFEYPKCEHIYENNCTIDEVRSVIIMAVPFVDSLTTNLDHSLPLTVGEFDEFGNAKENKEHFEYIYSYAPYNNIKKMDYPHMLITTSLSDNRVLFDEPTKFTAKLREYKTDNNLLLLKTEMNAGHGGKSGRSSSISKL